MLLRMSELSKITFIKCYITYPCFTTCNIYTIEKNHKYFKKNIYNELIYNELGIRITYNSEIQTTSTVPTNYPLTS